MQTRFDLERLEAVANLNWRASVVTDRIDQP